MKRLKILCLIGVLSFTVYSCKSEKKRGVADEASAFLESYNKKYRELATASAEAEWVLNTHIVEGDTVARHEAEVANKAFADYTGSEEVIKQARSFLEHRDELSDLQVRQLEKILYLAGANPATAGDVISDLIAANALQTELLYGYRFILNGEEVSTNDLDEILRSSDDPKARIEAWECSKSVGKELKENLVNLRNLRNQSVQALDYRDYFSYQVSDYGMTADEMMALNEKLIREVWPLYRELHTWARYELASRYHEPVPDYLPAHWLPNRWGQDWLGLAPESGMSIDEKLKSKGAEWIVRQGEAFYKSLGYESLPASFYEKSSLYPLPEDANYKKNNHASAWHIDLDRDVRSLMSVVPNTDWWETVLHELGHIYYYLQYSNPRVPIVLREGANRAFHEAMGSLIGLASLQKPFLQQMKLLPEDLETDSMQTMLKEALNYIVFIPWSSGVMTHFEHDFYAKNLPADSMNARWWEYKKRYQGIVPPYERGEDFCDASSKTHINNDPAQYYDYAISYVLLFQLHDHIARKILKQNPHASNYYGSTATGDFLKSLMHPGATKDWKELMQETLGSGLSAKPMLQYFEPLMDYLKEINKGRKYTLPEEL